MLIFRFPLPQKGQSILDEKSFYLNLKGLNARTKILAIIKNKTQNKQNKMI